ncbi:MAG: tryptophan synthase subunit alpha [Gammaproteobacteria bacterium]
MSRIQTLFQHKKAYVGYLTIGVEGLENNYQQAKALIAGGVNMLELGVPFSDPVADGVVIQRASLRALENGITLWDVIELAKKIRAEFDIPLIIFSYFNPLLAAKPQHWLSLAHEAGIDGVLVVDLPYEEGQSFYRLCHQHHLDAIAVITPATPPARLQKIVKHAKGFLYYACQKGTTGVRAGLPDDMKEKILTIKQHSNLPVVVGFGISDRESVHSILHDAEGVVVGSRFMQAIEDKVSSTQLTELARSFTL